MTQYRIPAVYMRGGTSKGLFFLKDDLPGDADLRERVLLRAMGSPDVYEKQIDGMGGATSSTSKVVLISKSERPDCDIDYLFGQVTIDRPLIDWSGNCGNLTSAVGPFAIAHGLVAGAAGLRDGTATVRIWQANLGKRIIEHVPMRNGQVLEEGSFLLDGVAFPASEITIEYLDPGGSADVPLLPTANSSDVLDVPGVGKIQATLINAGNPSVIVRARDLGLSGTEMQSQVNGNEEVLARCEAVRAAGAVAMKLASCAEEATRCRPANPKIAFVAPSHRYLTAGGKTVPPEEMDVLVRILSMGKLHHAVTGTGAVALAVAAVLPGTVVHEIVEGNFEAGSQLRMGHPSGVMAAGAHARQENGVWVVEKVVMSRSARRLMEGWVFVPMD